MNSVKQVYFQHSIEALRSALWGNEAQVMSTLREGGTMIKCWNSVTDLACLGRKSLSLPQLFSSCSSLPHPNISYNKIHFWNKSKNKQTALREWKLKLIK